MLLFRASASAAHPEGTRHNQTNLQEVTEQTETKGERLITSVASVLSCSKNFLLQNKNCRVCNAKNETIRALAVFASFYKLLADW